MGCDLRCVLRAGLTRIFDDSGNRTTASNREGNSAVLKKLWAVLLADENSLSLYEVRQTSSVMIQGIACPSLFRRVTCHVEEFCAGSVILTLLHTGHNIRCMVDVELSIVEGRGIDARCPFEKNGRKLNTPIVGI